MFKTGDRIKILTSSFKGKTGPKRGSTGFVINALEPYYLPDERCCVSPISVLFTRYGFEKGPRSEKRLFLGIIPIPYVPPYEFNKEAIDKTIHSSIEHLIKTDFKGRIWDDIKSVLGRGGKNIPTGIIVPSEIIPNLLKCDPKELRAWLNSFLLDHDTGQLINNIIASEYMKGMVKDKFTADLLIKMTLSKSFKFDMFKTIEENEPMRKGLIDTIRLVVVIGNMRQRERQERRVRKWFKENFIDQDLGGHAPGHLETEIVKILSNNLFCDYTFLKKKEMVKSAGIGSLNALMTSVSLVRDYLIRLAPTSEDCELLYHKPHGSRKECQHAQHKVPDVRQAKGQALL